MDIYDFLWAKKNGDGVGVGKRIADCPVEIKGDADAYKLDCMDLFRTNTTVFNNNLYTPASSWKIMGGAKNQPLDGDILVESLKPRVPIFDSKSARQMQSLFTATRDNKKLTLSVSLPHGKTPNIEEKLHTLHSVIKKYEQKYKYMIFINNKYDQLMPHLSPYNPSFVLFDLFEDRHQNYLKYFIPNSLCLSPPNLFKHLESFDNRFIFTPLKSQGHSNPI